MPATEARATMSTHGIKLVDEDNARCLFFRLIEHGTNARRADADKHFHKV